MHEYAIGHRRGQYELTYYDEAGARHRHALGTTDPTEAEKLAPAVYHHLTRPSGSTVEALWMGYLRDKAGKAVLRAMKHTWRILAPRFGAMRATDITIEDCRAHTRARQAAGIGDGTIWTELGHLRMVLRWAEKHQLIDRAPAIEKPSKPKPHAEPLTREQVRTLLDAAKSIPHIEVFVTLAIGTAARNAAILDLTWDRVHFDTGLIDLKDPTITRPHKGRAVVPMNAMVRRVLEQHKPVTPGGYVVSWKGKRVRAVVGALTRLAARARVAGVHPHILRHTAAVHMIQNGVSMEEVSQFLGHSNVQITRLVYARFTPGHLQKAAKSLEY